MFFQKNKPIHIFATPDKTIIPEKNYSTLSKNGYEKNVIVYRCINLIAKSAASVPLILYQNKHEVTTHHLLKALLKEPSPHMNYYSFMETLISYYLLSGNAYAMFDQKYLKLLKPDTISIITNSEDEITHYRMTKNNIIKNYPSNEVLHIKNFHPRSEYYGFSPLEAASSSIEQHNAVASHNIHLMKNGGRPSGALLLEGGMTSAIQREELKQELNQFYTGESNAGRLLLLEGGFKWVEMGLSPKDMDFMSAKNIAACEIATSFGISPILVGLIEDSSYNNYKEARMQLWEDTVIPLLSHVISLLNMFLHRFYDESLMLSFNTDHISALTSQHDNTWRKLNECSFLTKNEKREAVGYSPILQKNREE